MRALSGRIIGACLCAALLAALPATARCAEADDILGLWDNAEKDAKIRIVRCGEKYCGDIVWLKDSNYPEGSRDGVPGSPYLNHNSPDPKLRREPLLGLRIMRAFSYADGAWSGGSVYDPKDGQTYRGKMTLASPTRLSLRGYVGIPLFGRTSHWSRAEP